jgi:hypothetical protein
VHRALWPVLGLVVALGVALALGLRQAPAAVPPTASEVAR